MSKKKDEKKAQMFPPALRDVLQKNTYSEPDDMSETELPLATMEIYQHIYESLGRKQKDTHINRASSATYCYKRLWYQKEGFEGEQLAPRRIINFALGDLTEHMVKFWILKACVGPGKTYSEVDFGKEVGRFTIQNGYEIIMYAQEDLVADIEGIKMTAHVDGWGKRNVDGEWELIEIKSTTSFGFPKFKDKGPEDYLKQAHVNLQTNKAKELGAKDVVFFYLNKNTAHLWDRRYRFNPLFAKQVAEEIRTANQKKAPDRPPWVSTAEETYYKKPTGRIVLDFPCTYCPYKKHCWPNAEIDFKGSKPVWAVKQIKLKLVKENDDDSK